MAIAFRFRRIIPLVVMLLLPTALMANWWHESSHHEGRKYKPPRPTAAITVEVTSRRFHKPVNDAHVIFHSTRENRPDGYMEMKTNRQGKAKITVVPVGDTLVLQVLKRGYQSFGQVYKIDSPKKHIKVVLLPPQPQFSAYRSHPTGQTGDGGKGTTKPQSNQQGSSSSHQKK